MADIETLQKRLRIMSTLTGVLIVAVMFNLSSSFVSHNQYNATLTQTSADDPLDACYVEWKECYLHTDESAGCLSDFEQCILNTET